jgi:enamine deaminase RidA (YjgF/YER057c/UK114 family)
MRRFGVLEGASVAGTASKRRISSASPFEQVIGFSRAVAAGDRVLVSGTGPVFADGSCPEDAAAQASRCIEIIAAALDQAGLGLDEVIRTRMYLTSAADAEAIGAVHREAFSTARPAATMVIVAGLVDPHWKVEIEAEAMTCP